MVCVHCGYQLPPLSRPGRKYCSDRCRGRAQRHQPYTGPNRRWTPLHPVDEPAIRFRWRQPRMPRTHLPAQPDMVQRRMQAGCAPPTSQQGRRESDRGADDNGSDGDVPTDGHPDGAGGDGSMHLTRSPTTTRRGSSAWGTTTSTVSGWAAEQSGTTYKCSYPDGGQDICIRMDVGISEKVAGACVYYPSGTSPGPL